MLAVIPAVAQLQQDRMLLVRHLAGSSEPAAAELQHILDSGTRPWEQLRDPPLVLEHAGGTIYFVLEPNWSLREPPHPPRAMRELILARAVERVLRYEGNAPWPVLVFSGVMNGRAGVDAVSLAATRRIILRDEHGRFHRAAAIVLNSAYWGGANAMPVPADDPFSLMVARHEVYHARRAWLRSAETAADAGEIEARLHAPVSPALRTHLERLVSEAKIAAEEMSAIDRSLRAASMLASRRQSILEYRERNRQVQLGAVRLLLEFFDTPRRKDFQKWLLALTGTQSPRAASVAVSASR